MSDDAGRILQALAAMRGDMTDQFSAIRAELNDVRASVNGARVELTDVRTELIARMDRLQDDIFSIRDDITTNFGATDTVRRTHEATWEELRSLCDLVMNMERQIQRLQSDVRALRGE